MAMRDGHSGTGRRPDDPSALSIQQAIDRYISKRQTDRSDRTLRSYRNRLGRFAEWCDRQGLTTLDDLDAWVLDEYDVWLRDGDRAPATIKGHLTTLRVFLKYARDLEAVPESLPESVDVPSLDPTEEQSDQRLAAADATAALQFFRESPEWRGKPHHAFLEVAWHTGARIGSLRGLDLGDYDRDEQFIAFVHRPDTDTPLKNKERGERLVGLNDHVCNALNVYIARERSDTRDEYGREPLFAGRQGQQSFSTLRAWSYQATHPCHYTECPHGKRRESCQWTQRSHASKCPSSRSPHRVRTGSITWQLNRGLDIEPVATRVNVSPQVIRDHYDAATGREEFDQRRRAVEQALDIDDTAEEDGTG